MAAAARLTKEAWSKRAKESSFAGRSYIRPGGRISRSISEDDPSSQKHRLHFENSKLAPDNVLQRMELIQGEARRWTAREFTRLSGLVAE
jgi:hypothetical protein